MVEERLAPPTGLAEYFDSSRSPLNPYNRGDTSFVYGTLPVFLAKAIGSLVRKTSYGGTYLVGRGLSAFFDLISVWLVYRIARRLGGRGMALLAAALLAFCPLAIQLSHFWAVDTYLTLFTACTLLGCVRHALGRSGPLGDALTGLALGLAVACKITALALVGPVGLAVMIRWLPTRFPPDRRELARGILGASARLALVLAVAAVAVRVALPYAFLGPSPFSFRLDPRYLDDIKRLTALSKSISGFPPAFQWAERSFLFPLKNMVLWGAGPLFGLASLASLIWGVVALRRRRAWAIAPVLAHALFLIAYHGTSNVKAMRYWYPAYPGLAVLAALFLFWVRRSSCGSSFGARLARTSPALVLAGTLLAGFAFSRIYTRPVTRVAASDWIFRNVPPARFAGESWDDGLPMSRPGGDNGPYGGPALPLFDPDSREKVDALIHALSETDWIAVTSNRVYANVTRIPDVFPMTIAYYRALFEGRLGFERIADFTSYPSLGPLRFPDDIAEEQFTVYDHPRVLLFRKTKDFSVSRAHQILVAALPKSPPTIAEWEQWPSAYRRVVPPVRPGRRPAAEKPLGAERVEAPVNSWVAAGVFFLASSVVGLFAFPLAWIAFPKLQDRGAGIARVLGLLVATYLLTLSVQIHLLPNGRLAALLCLVVLVASGSLVFWKQRAAIRLFCWEKRRLLLQSEIAYAAGFLFFAAMRALNPEIYWGEKPMDFSILNILVRTPTLPPSDPWFAGAPLGYYTFGQEIVAFLTLLTDIPTRYTFNLAFGLVGGLTLQAAFTLLRNWTGTGTAGLAGGAFVGLIGNLSGIREWLINQPASGQSRHLDWHYFWATSRVVPHTINEYPFWSLLFADLHAHVLAIPLFLFVAFCALQFVRTHTDEASSWPLKLLSAALLGFAVAAQALTNAWDVPLLAGLLVLFLLVAACPKGRFSLRSIGRSCLFTSAAAGFALILILPLWAQGGGAPGFGRNLEPGARGADILTVFGFFFFLAIAWWCFAAYRRLRETGWSKGNAVFALAALATLLGALAFLIPSAFCAAAILLFLLATIALSPEPEDRLAFGFLATGFFLVLFTQHFFIYDRMNTFFKLYLEAWLLFAVATAALLFRTTAHSGVFSNWPLAFRGVFFALLAASLFTTVSAGQGAIDRTTSPSAQEPPPAAGPRRFVPARGPTLDGTRYLEDRRPGEYRAVLWLRRAIQGTPVVLEAQGPSYQDFGRISMLTGLPTVMGWDHHVKQRGNPEAEVSERIAAVRQIYSSRDPAAIERLLRRYHVGYVYVGWLERETYPAEGLAKFGTAADLFDLVYDNGETRVYRVIGGDTQDVLTLTRERVPAVAPSGTRASDTEPEEPPLILERAKGDQAPFAGMREPRDAAIDPKGRLWVADFGNSRLRIFDTKGGFLGGWGGRGNGTFGLREPAGVAVRGSDLYVADTWNGRVQHYTTDGEWKNSATGLYGPRGIMTAPDGSVWVSDTGNHRIVRFDSSLQKIGSFGKAGAGRGEFAGPVGIAAGPGGRVYVADTGNRRIQILDDQGILLLEWLVVGWRSPGEPHLEVEADGTVYVTDPEANAVLVMDPSGAPLSPILTSDDGQPFARPTGLAFDREARILYVVNSGNATVSSFTLARNRRR